MLENTEIHLLRKEEKTQYIGGVMDDSPHIFGMLSDQLGHIYTCQWKSGVINGLCHIKFEDNVEFIGEYREGRKNGLGILINNLRIYRGEFFENKRDGLGELIDFEDHQLAYSHFKFENQEPLFSHARCIKIGNFVDNVMEGFGTICYPQQSLIYEGDFKAGKKHGFGEQRDPSGRFTGFFKNGNRDGPGTFKGDTSFTGYFIKGLRENFGRESASTFIYEGQYHRGRREGIGRLQIVNSDHYLGEFIKNKYHGLGKLEQNGSLFIGHFLQGRKSGVGFQKQDDGTIFFGEWSNGIRRGQGFEKDGQCEYTGAFDFGLKHGKGILNDKIQGRYIVLYESDKLIEKRCLEQEIISSTYDKKSVRSFLEQSVNHLKNIGEEIDIEINSLEQKNYELNLDNSKEKKDLTIRIERNKRKLEDILIRFTRMNQEFHLRLHDEITSHRSTNRSTENELPFTGLSDSMIKNELMRDTENSFRKIYEEYEIEMSNISKKMKSPSKKSVGDLPKDCLTPLKVRLQDEREDIEESKLLLQEQIDRIQRSKEKIKRLIIENHEVGEQSLTKADQLIDQKSTKTADITNDLQPTPKKEYFIDKYFEEVLLGNSGYNCILLVKEMILLGGESGILQFKFRDNEWNISGANSSIKVDSLGYCEASDEIVAIESRSPILVIINKNLQEIRRIGVKLNISMAKNIADPNRGLFVEGTKIVYRFLQELIIADIKEGIITHKKCLHLDSIPTGPFSSFAINLYSQSFVSVIQEDAIRMCYTSLTNPKLECREITQVSQKFRVCKSFTCLQYLDEERLLVGGEAELEGGKKRPFIFLASVATKITPISGNIIDQERAGGVHSILLKIHDDQMLAFCGSDGWAFVFRIAQNSLQLIQKLEVSKEQWKFKSLEIFEKSIFLLAPHEGCLLIGRMKTSVKPAPKKILAEVKDKDDYFNFISIPIQQQKMIFPSEIISKYTLSMIPTNQIFDDALGHSEQKIDLNIIRSYMDEILRPHELKGLVAIDGSLIKVFTIDDGSILVKTKKDSFIYPQSTFLRYDQNRSIVAMKDNSDTITFVDISRCKEIKFKKAMRDTEEYRLLNVHVNQNEGLCAIFFNGSNFVTESCLIRICSQSFSRNHFLHQSLQIIEAVEVGILSSELFILGSQEGKSVILSLKFDSSLSQINRFTFDEERLFDLIRLKGTNTLFIVSSQYGLFVNYQNEQFNIERRLDFGDEKQIQRISVNYIQIFIEFGKQPSKYGLLSHKDNSRLLEPDDQILRESVDILEDSWNQINRENIMTELDSVALLKKMQTALKSHTLQRASQSHTSLHSSYHTKSISVYNSHQSNELIRLAVTTLGVYYISAEYNVLYCEKEGVRKLPFLLTDKKTHNLHSYRDVCIAFGVEQASLMCFRAQEMIYQVHGLVLGNSAPLVAGVTNYNVQPHSKSFLWLRGDNMIAKMDYSEEMKLEKSNIFEMTEEKSGFVILSVDLLGSKIICLIFQESSNTLKLVIIDTTTSSRQAHLLSSLGPDQIFTSAVATEGNCSDSCTNILLCGSEIARQRRALRGARGVLLRLSCIGTSLLCDSLIRTSSKSRYSSLKRISSNRYLGLIGHEIHIIYIHQNGEIEVVEKISQIQDNEYVDVSEDCWGAWFSLCKGSLAAEKVWEKIDGGN